MNEKPDLGALFGATSADTFFGLEKCDDFDAIDASSAFIGARVQHLMARLARMRKMVLPLCVRQLHP